MSQRFFVDHPITGLTARLTGQEADHLAKVMRAQVGDAVTLFDGGGAEFAARVQSIGRSEVQLEVLDRREVDREASRQATLGVALPKGDRARWLIEKGVELGIAQVTPLVTQRGVAQPTEKALTRLRRAVIAASKQCGRNRLMEITEARSIDEFLRTAPEDAVRLLAHVPPDAPMDDAASAAKAIHEDEAAPLYAAIGPEGGFTDEEVDQARSHGWRIVHLGPRTLRVETAAAAIAVLSTTHHTHRDKQQ